MHSTHPAIYVALLLVRATHPPLPSEKPPLTRTCASSWHSPLTSRPLPPITGTHQPKKSPPAPPRSGGATPCSTSASSPNPPSPPARTTASSSRPSASTCPHTSPTSSGTSPARAGGSYGANFLRPGASARRCRRRRSVWRVGGWMSL